MSSEDIEASTIQALFPEKPRKSQRSKLAIVEGAIEFYAEQGAAAASFEAIAKRSGVSRPLVKHYFETPEELHLIALRLVRTRLQELQMRQIQSAIGSWPRFEAYVRSYFEWLRVSPNHVRTWIGFCAVPAAGDSLGAFQSEVHDQDHERLSGMLIAAAPQRTKPQAMYRRAMSIHALIIGALVCLINEHGESDFQEIADQITQDSLRLARK